MRRMIIGALSALALLACATPFEKIELDGLPTADQLPDAKRVVLLEEEVVDFHPGDGGAVAVVTNRRRIKTLRETGGITDVSVAFGEDTGTLELLALHGVPANGDPEIDVNMGGAIDRPLHDGVSLYNNDRVVSLNGGPLANMPVGSVSESLARVRHKTVREYQFAHIFGGADPSVLVRFQVKVHPGWEVEYKSFEGGKEIKWAPERTATPNGGETLTWEKRDMPGIDDPSGTAAATYQPQVWVRLKKWTVRGETQTAFSSFSELSKDKFVRYQEKATESAEIKALSALILKDVKGGEREKAAALFAWVRDKVSYCAYYPTFSEGFFPHEATKTESLRYGDCKDKANLLHVLLRGQGIKSRLATLFRHNGFPRQLVFPNLVGNSNHVAVLVNVGGEDVFADPTNPGVPFGELDSDEYGAWVLPISAKGEEPIQLGWPKPTDNVDKYRASITVQDDLARELTFTREQTGSFAVKGRRDLRGAIKANWKSVVSLPGGGGVEELTVSSEDAPALPQPLKMSGKAKTPAPKDPGNLKMLNAASFGWRVPGASTARHAAPLNPLVLSHPYVKDYELKITYPNAAAISTVPPPQKVKSQFGEVEVSFVKNGRVLTVRYKETHRAPFVGADKYDAFQAWVRDVDAAAVASAVVVQKGGA